MSLASVRPRVVVLGIDGAPFTLLTRYAQSGLMPHLAALLPSSTFCQMDVSLPEVSSTSWTSFATGVNPAKHGIYGFVDLVPGQYQRIFPNASAVRSPSLWDILSNHGRTSVVINVPQTYPARAIRGALISGFVATDLAQAVYPRILLPRLKALNYQLDVETQSAKAGRLDVFLDACFETLRSHARAFDLLWTHQAWDLFVATITGTDRLHHFLWAAEGDPSHPQHAGFRAFYQEVDSILGSLAARLQSNDVLMIVSDHGFTTIRQEVYLNRWLETEGYLRFHGDGTSLEQISPDSRAFAMDPSRIYLNRVGRYPEGSVSPEQIPALTEELREKLLKLSWQAPDGQVYPVVKAVYRRDEIYHGACIDQAPDLVVLSHHGFDLKGALGKPEVFGRSHFTGMHTRDDATFLITRPDLPARRPHIEDIAPTVLELLGLPAPAHFDGRSLLHP